MEKIIKQIDNLFYEINTSEIDIILVRSQLCQPTNIVGDIAHEMAKQSPDLTAKSNGKPV